ncbi:MAG: metallophosphoesterase [Clostridia bacterium]|nr:metallophosphoesterase [Clostridia bacterium]
MIDTEAKKKYFDQGVELFDGDPAKPETCIYRLTESGVHFRLHEIDSGLGGDPVEIVQFTDVHFNFCNEKDRENRELQGTLEKRKWLSNAASVVSCQKAMEYASFFDQTVITGDILDYLSDGAIDLMWEHIWNVDPDVLCAVGGHEFTRQVQTGMPDQTSFSSRRATVQAAWKHRIDYVSKIVGDKAMVIVMDNNYASFYDSQVEPLRADLALAREKGYAVLLFMHEPISTGREADRAVKAIHVYDGEYYDIYEKCCAGAHSGGVTATVYRMITENADLVRGIYVGHLHSAYYTEVIGSYLDESEVRREKMIPQFVLEGNPYDKHCGHVLKITVR